MVQTKHFFFRLHTKAHRNFTEEIMHLSPSNPPSSWSILALLSLLFTFKKSRQIFVMLLHAFTRSFLERLKGSLLYRTLSEVIVPNHGAVLRDRDASEILANVTVSNASSEFSGCTVIVHSSSSKRGRARRPTRKRISRI